MSSILRRLAVNLAITVLSQSSVIGRRIRSFQRIDDLVIKRLF
jgi:hypothetical protein